MYICIYIYIYIYIYKSLYISPGPTRNPRPISHPQRPRAGERAATVRSRSVYK